MISVIIPVYNSASTLDRCLQALRASAYSDYECIVVDDGSTDESAAVADAHATHLVKMSGRPRGPAYARNRGAEAARGDILFFVDADAVVHPDALTRVADTFAGHPEADAVFGSYDDNPEGREFLSRYKNLFHHFVHQQAGEEAVTFWAGCGAVRRRVFLAIGGFDEIRYPRPSIEDIELGYRLRSCGHTIVLNKELQVQHLKRWTLRGMIKTDVVDRGIPWTQLLMQEGRLPNALNLHISQRISALLLSSVLAYLAFIALFHEIILLPLVAGLFLLVAGTWSEGTPHFHMNRRARTLTYLLIGVIAVLALRAGQVRFLLFLVPLVFGILVDHWLPQSNRLWQRVAFGVTVLALVTCVAVLLVSFSIRLGAPVVALIFLIMVVNRRFYIFFARRQGVLFTFAVLPFHLFYYLYSLVAVVAGVVVHLGQPQRTPSPAPVRSAIATGTFEKDVSEPVDSERSTSPPASCTTLEGAPGIAEKAPRGGVTP